MSNPLAGEKFDESTQVSLTEATSDLCAAVLTVSLCSASCKASSVRSDLSLEFAGSRDAECRSSAEQEQTKARLQQSIHQFTEMCWDKCVCSPARRTLEGC